MRAARWLHLFFTTAAMGEGGGPGGSGAGGQKSRRSSATAGEFAPDCQRDRPRARAPYASGPEGPRADGERDKVLVTDTAGRGAEWSYACGPCFSASFPGSQSGAK